MYNIKISKKVFLDSVSDLGHPCRMMFPKGCVLKVIATPQGYMYTHHSALGTQSWSYFFAKESVELL
jgi:hypothetical protein